MLIIMMMTVDVHQKCEHFGLDLGLASYGLGLGLESYGLGLVLVLPLLVFPDMYCNVSGLLTLLLSIIIIMTSDKK